MEKINWICVYKSIRKFEAEALLGHLQAEDIAAVLINKQDAYMNGYVEIHVPEAFRAAAERMIAETNS
jgi:hypothetical protein